MKRMKMVVSIVAAGFLLFGTDLAVAKVNPTPGYQDKIVEHGGGCRKSSPPGMCCHMDNSTGIVHCH